MRSNITIKINTEGSTAIFIGDSLLSVNKPSSIWVNDVPCPQCGKIGSYAGGMVYFCPTCESEY